MVASLIETCKLNAVDPEAWPVSTLTSLAAGHSSQRLDEFMPSNYKPSVG